MPSVRESRELPYSADQMFDLVSDVERYPEFVPGYARVRILRHRGRTLEVEQTLRLGPLPIRFISCAELQRPGRISVHNLDGPFARLAVEWHFESLDSGCRVLFEAGYRLDAGPLEPLLRHWFNHVSTRMLGAFLARAKSRYGQPAY